MLGSELRGFVRRVLTSNVIGRVCVLFAGVLMVCGSTPVFGACTGSGTTYSCTAGSTSADVSSALGSATDGAVITFAAGTYNWGSFVSFSNSRGASLVCASPGACVVNVSGTVLGMNGNLSGTNTKTYRISGFEFRGSTGAFVLWFYGPGTLSKLRIDNNKFTNISGEPFLIFLGENSTVANFYGVIDHNTVISSGSVGLLGYIGARNDTPPASPQSTANNMFVEDNSVSITTMTNAGLGCVDAWGGASIVWRYNTTKNCLVTSHGVVHAGGSQNFEFYGNKLTVDAGASSFTDCYRCFHHQGSGEFMAFNNTFTASGGKSSSAISMTHYRSATPTAAGYDSALGRCDGTSAIDGNRSPAGTYYGYPCWRQPGRDFAGRLFPMYVWNNRWSDTGARIPMAIEDPWGATNPGVSDHIKPERDYYNSVSASAQSSSTSPFTGATGVGFGTLANRPTTCTTNSAEAGGGVGYFATDQGAAGTLYRCSATNVWSVHYIPYTYPHPMVGGVSGPLPPSSVQATIQ